MKLLLLAILGMIIIAPIVLDNAFGAVPYENICNTLKHIPSNSWKLFLCSTVEINEDTLDSFGFSLNDNFRFGDSVANIGDLDGDGVNDLAVGAVNDDTRSNGSFGGANYNAGAVHILFLNREGGLARDTAVINDFTTNGPVLAEGDAFGMGVANIGDLDGNGYDDLAASAMLDHANDRGAVHILFMDENGGLAKATETIDGTTTNGPTLSDDDRFGNAVANMGDIDGNGVNDLAVGARQDDEGGSTSGAVHILFMNSDGSVEETIEINSSTDKGPTLSAGDAFGTGLAHIGDLNGDGVNDLVVGADTHDGNGGSNAKRGIVYILFFTSEVKKSGSGCPDCVPPSISKRGLAEIPDGFKINDEIISVKKYTNNPSQPYEVNVGDPVTFNLRAYENSGPMNIIFSAVYMDMYGKSISRYDSSAYVRYHMDDQSVEYIDKNDIFFAVGVTHEVTKPYPNINQEMTDITFTIIFAKPMETSHIVMELWDNKRNPEWINIRDALKVSEIPVVEEPIPQSEVPKQPEIQIEKEPIPESPLEPEPEPAPLPDEEIVLTETEPEKSILSFVDTSKEPNHYVKRYVTETEYQEWFDTNYPDYTIWEAVGITQHEYDAIAHKIESEPKLILISEPHYYMEAEKEPQIFELESTYESEPSPRKSVQEKNDFWSWFFSMFS